MQIGSKSGKVDITLYRAGYGGVRIPAEMLADSVEVTGDEGSVSNETFAGTFTKPSQTYEEPQVTFTLVMTAAALRQVYPELSTPSTDRPTIAGQTVFGGSECVVREPAKLVIHWTCDGNSDEDWYFPEVLLSQNFSATFTPGEVLTIPVVGHIQPSSELNGGLVRVGTGDLTQPTIFDEDTGEYVPITS